jgi:hypothetical protein
MLYRCLPSVPFTLPSQNPLNPLRDFYETIYKERSHCVDVHIVWGALFNYFSKRYGPGLSPLFEKYLSSQLFLNPLGILMKLGTKKDHIV